MGIKKIIIFLLVASNLMAISVENEGFKEAGENYLYEINIPKIKSEDIKFQTEFNRNMQKIKNNAIENILKISQENGEDVSQNQLIIRYDDYTSEIGIASIVLETYEYTGGAHGMSNLSVFNLDSKTGKDIPIEEIIKPEGLNYLQNQIQKDIQNNLNGPSEEWIYFSDAKADIKNAKIYFENDFIVIVFGLYDIAPYSSGMSTFKYPLDKIKEFLLK
ncbi:DUF3298 and DUF4163 domain-containing protein [Cetobacterium sp. 8H]|uniref:DUF3298 and DUF4163 domain-containing protein n=1 Tax=Cetobacterium sp. 8H TaxID=2759681 RepID=UPI00163B8C7A|nr:DUF3298 and DUF4163 domain-containing protein [Cetobacterium sp. 8H]MBC2851877.1 DUF3298 and DUF4163 domain-containing protein [Cetobacterium sp. 8H]